MKWTHATGLLATLGLIAAGGVWAGCSNGDNGNDGGTDSGGNDVNQGQDTGGGDSGNDTGTPDSGAGVDASVLDCNYYCDNILTACSTATTKQYLDKATCVAMCANIPNDAGAGAQSGDSLACRMYHLSVAAQAGQADTHCPHAGPYGFGLCGTLCNDFCEQDFAQAGPCKGTNYSNLDQCHNYCNAAAGGDAGAGAPGTSASSPSMACREYHLENAYGVAASHCPHAGFDGGGICN
jgi:hypothetical protein